MEREAGWVMGLSSHQLTEGKNNEWLTPPGIIRCLGHFDLDPCAPTVRPWSTARLHYTIKDDGLSKEWTGRVWLNPPFNRYRVHEWMHRMATHGDGVMLIAARTETKAFFDHVWNAADSVLFLRGRPHFHYVDGTRAPFNSGAPICLVAYGASNTQALIESRLGFVTVLGGARS